MWSPSTPSAAVALVGHPGGSGEALRAALHFELDLAIGTQAGAEDGCVVRQLLYREHAEGNHVDLVVRVRCPVGAVPRASKPRPGRGPRRDLGSLLCSAPVQYLPAHHKTSG